MSDIAKLAKIKVPSIYSHFASKDELVMLVVEKEINTYFEYIRSIIAEIISEDLKKHSESGYQILKSVDAYSSLAEDVLAHHERFDGKGYPRGLRGDQIPLIGRIISLADAYEAMISDRPYRKGITHESALEEIVRCSGTQFDPVVTKAFISLFDTINTKRSEDHD